VVFSLSRAAEREKRNGRWRVSEGGSGASNASGLGQRGVPCAYVQRESHERRTELLLAWDGGEALHWLLEVVAEHGAPFWKLAAVQEPLDGVVALVLDRLVKYGRRRGGQMR